MSGRVYLVGAGPGDPELLTLKGLRCLREADFVLYDGLVNPLLLRHTRAEVERSNRARTADGGRLNQEEINRTLIDHALRGEVVVRLKGGDPYIFGRGSEEATALAEMGIPFEVVPGITAATAAGAYSGVSLTHRHHSSAVAFITGHEDPTKSESRLEYDALAKFPGTLVFYMGLHRLPLITAGLMDSGLDPATPAALISRASVSAQRSIEGTIAELPAIADQAGLTAPSLIIIGDCLNQPREIDWFTSQPLFGLRIGITRSSEQAEAQIGKCTQLGAQPMLMPTIEIEPVSETQELDSTIERLGEFDWLIFTSSNGVHAFLRRVEELGLDMRLLARVQIACIGARTAETLSEYHLKSDVIPDEFRAEALAAALVPLASGKRFLWAGANRGREVLSDELTAAGGAVEKVVVYQNNDVDAFSDSVVESLIAGEVDWIGLSSPSIARNLARLLPAEAHQHLKSGSIRLASISPVTTAAATDSGLPIAVTAEVYTWEGIFDAIRAYAET